MRSIVLTAPFAQQWQELTPQVIQILQEITRQILTKDLDTCMCMRRRRANDLANML